MREFVGDSKELNRDLASRVSPRVASQAHLPQETAARPLRTGKNRLRIDGLDLDRWGERQQIYLDPLVSHESQTGTPMLSAPPILPEERCGANGERMKQHADLARLFGRATIPLTLLTERAGAATVDAGSIDHTQASIGFSALLMRG